MTCRQSCDVIQVPAAYTLLCTLHCVPGHAFCDAIVATASDVIITVLRSWRTMRSSFRSRLESMPRCRQTADQ
ncbi:hypothetical protein TNCV_4611521 [Trichonephila clavipes]|nr:hypothetical protein TNCV_4611521 [Trichonephila clavipes]